MMTKSGKHCPNVKMKPCTTRHEPKGHAMVEIEPGRWVGVETAYAQARLATPTRK